MPRCAGGFQRGRQTGSLIKANDRAEQVTVDVRSWHKADMLNALTNVRFWGQSGHRQPLLYNLDL
jgi:hypothetical protein